MIGTNKIENMVIKYKRYKSMRKEIFAIYPFDLYITEEKYYSIYHLLFTFILFY